MSTKSFSGYCDHFLLKVKKVLICKYTICNVVFFHQGNAWSSSEAVCARNHWTGEAGKVENPRG